MIIEFASFSEIGPRDSNQDRLLVPAVREGRRFVAAIADGVGGAPGGAEAAQIAIDTAASFTGPSDELSSVFATAVEQIRQVSYSDHKLSGMGTTLTIVLIEGNVVNVAHAGDTRVYHLRRSGLNTLTKDQTEVAELLRRGVLSKQRARRYPRRNILLSALNANADYEVHLASAGLLPGDRLLLISDGVYQRLRRGKILNVSLTNSSVAKFAEQLMVCVKEADPSDNFSALAIEIVQ